MKSLQQPAITFSPFAELQGLCQNAERVSPGFSGTARPLPVNYSHSPRRGFHKTFDVYFSRAKGQTSIPLPSSPFTCSCLCSAMIPSPSNRFPHNLLPNLSSFAGDDFVFPVPQSFTFPLFSARVPAASRNTPPPKPAALFSPAGPPPFPSPFFK